MVVVVFFTVCLDKNCLPEINSKSSNCIKKETIELVNEITTVYLGHDSFVTVC